MNSDFFKGIKNKIFKSPQNSIYNDKSNNEGNFQKENPDPSKWKEIYKQTENLYFIREFQFCFIKCIDLFNNIIDLFKTKLDLRMDCDIYVLIFKVNEISPKLANIFQQFVEFEQKFRNYNNEKDLEKLLSLLNQIFLLIKIQKKSSINSFELKMKNNNFGTTDGNRNMIEEVDDHLWEELKNAIINFEKRLDQIR